MKKKVTAIIILIGFLLSSLTPWNDIYINIPIAYLFAFLVGLFSERLFILALIAGYWLTNIIGLMMIHYGVTRYNDKKINYTRKQLIIDIIASLGITALLILLIKIRWLRSPSGYFGKQRFAFRSQISDHLAFIVIDH